MARQRPRRPLPPQVGTAGAPPPAPGATPEPDARVNQTMDFLPPPLVDHHSRPVLHGELGLGRFERLLAGGVSGGAGTAGGSADGAGWFDSAAGLAVLRWCPPLLGLEPHCTPARYLARRREAGSYAARRMLLRGSGIAELLVDTTASVPGEAAAADGGEPVTVAELDAALPGGAGELVPLAELAAQVGATSGSVPAQLRNLGTALETAARSTAGFVCDAGPLLRYPEPARPPGRAEVIRAASAALAGHRGPATAALSHHLLLEALRTGRPVQLRCGDPAPLAGLLRETAGAGVVVLVPTGGRAHVRTSAELAARHGHVHTDAGADPAVALAVAPFGRVLFSTRAALLPELHVVRARAFERSLRALLGEWVADGACTPVAARRIAERVLGGNAREVYRRRDGRREDDASVTTTARHRVAVPR
ncbi:amidohydrolase [Streptomyces bohaiensis]|nr:amidohydrolase [Streptomyces bohaiensis]